MLILIENAVFSEEKIRSAHDKEVGTAKEVKEDSSSRMLLVGGGVGGITDLDDVGEQAQRLDSLVAWLFSVGWLAVNLFMAWTANAYCRTVRELLGDEINKFAGEAEDEVIPAQKVKVFNMLSPWLSRLALR